MEAGTAPDSKAIERQDVAVPDFPAVFAAHFESMKRLAFLLGADDPENVAQESFARLHARWSRLRDDGKALPYLRVDRAAAQAGDPGPRPTPDPDRGVGRCQRPGHRGCQHADSAERQARDTAGGDRG